MLPDITDRSRATARSRAAARPARPLLLLFLVALAAGALPGCSDDAGADARVELGTGMTVFEPLLEGQPLDLVAGPQGGYHFVVHARMRGLAPGDPRQPGLAENPTTWFRALDESGARVDIPEVRQLGYTPQPGAEGWYTLPSGRIMLIDNAAANALYGRPVTIEVQVRDAQGRTAGDAVQVTAVAYPPPGEGADAGVSGRPARAARE